MSENKVTLRKGKKEGRHKRDGRLGGGSGLIPDLPQSSRIREKSITSGERGSSRGKKEGSLISRGDAGK